MQVSNPARSLHDMTNESKYLPIVALAFKNAGLDPAFGCAIARQESNWNPNATASNPKDIARGGAYGLCQMTLKTAQGLGHANITPEQLLDPAINASVAAELCAENVRRLTVAPGQTYSLAALYADLAAMYNSGRPLARAPYVTATNYVPRVLKFMADYSAQFMQVSA